MPPVQPRLRAKTYPADTSGYKIQPVQVAQPVRSTYSVWQATLQLQVWAYIAFTLRSGVISSILSCAA